MNPASLAHLDALDLPADMRGHVERFVALVEEMLEMEVRDVFVDYNGINEAEVAAFLDLSVAIGRTPHRHSDLVLTTTVFALAGRIATASFDHDHKHQPNRLRLRVDLYDNGFELVASGDTRDHLMALFRRYILPHLSTIPLPGRMTPPAIDDNDDD